MSLIAILSGSVAIFSLGLLIVFRSPRARITPIPGNHSDSLRRSLLTRLCWPLIMAVSLMVLPLMTWGVRQRLTQAISQAGVPGWSCGQFFAMQLILGVASAVFLLLLFSLFHMSVSINHLWLLLILAMVMTTMPRLWLNSQRSKRYLEIERGLPFFLDMVNLGLESGMNLQTSVQLALDHLHSGPLKDEWRQTIFEIRSGISRAEAFGRMSQRIELVCIRQMVNAFIQGESMGLSLGRSITEFSRQQDHYRLLRSEKLALQAPIKMLFPLAFCIFPCTFLVLGFPVVAQLLGLE